MITISAQVPDDLNNSLQFVAKTLERSKSFIIIKAIEEYIREQLEDIEDAEEDLIRKNNPNRTFYTSEEVQKILEERLHV